MISELEPDEGPEEPGRTGAASDVLGAEPQGPGRWPWRWVLGTAVATVVVGAATLQAVGYGEPSRPDLHHYRLSGDGPCGGDVLQPLSSAFGPGRTDSTALVSRTGPVLDQGQCLFTARVPLAGTQWTAWYKVTVTVELHKKTDPAPEFEARNRHYGPDLDAFAVAATDATDRVTPVTGLGDRAYLLDGHRLDHALTVLHGGAVLTIDAAADEPWAGPGTAPPPDAAGLPPEPPGLPPLHEALIASMRRLMSALSG